MVKNIKFNEKYANLINNSVPRSFSIDRDRVYTIPSFDDCTLSREGFIYKYCLSENDKIKLKK